MNNLDSQIKHKKFYVNWAPSATTMKSIASELPANKQLNNISILQVKQSMSEIQGAS